MSIIEIKELLASCLQQLNSREIQYELFSFTLRKLRKLSVLELDYHCLDLITQLKQSFERFFSPAVSFSIPLPDEVLLLLAEFCHCLNSNCEAHHLFSKVSVSDSQPFRRLSLEILGGSDWQVSGLESFPDSLFHYKLGVNLKTRFTINPIEPSSSLQFLSGTKYTLLYSVNFAYFKQFVFPALCSAVVFGFSSVSINAVIVMPPDDVQSAEAYLSSSKLPTFINVTFFSDPSLLEENFKSKIEFNTALCCARFRWAYKLISLGISASTLIIVDADQLFISNFSLIDSFIPSEACIALADWSKILPFSTLYAKYGASIVVLRLQQSYKAFSYLETLATYLDEHFKNVRPLWTIDQLALLHVANICDINSGDLFNGLAPIISCGPISNPSFQDALLYNQAGAGKFAKNSYTELCSALTDKFLLA